MRTSVHIIRLVTVMVMVLASSAMAQSAPSIVSTSATDDGGNPTNSMLTDPVLSYTFDEAVFPGSGSLLLMESGGVTSQTYNVTSDARLSFAAATLTITPNVLTPNTSYYVQIPSGAITNSSGNSTNYPDSALTFTTGPFLTMALSNGKTTYTTTDLRGFDPTGYDKLVVCAMAESSVPTTMSWGSSNLTFVAGYRDFQMASMWFIDGPFTGPESFSVNNSSVGLSFLALKGTAPGVAAFDSVGSSSNTFTTTSSESFVVAGYNINGSTPPIASAPLRTYFSRLTASGSSSGSSGVVSNSSAGTQTFSFIGESSPILVIAEFVVGEDINPPAISAFVPSDDAGNSTNNLLTDAILNIDFGELISPGTGTVHLRKQEDDSIVESYDVTNSTKLAFTTGRLTITPNVLEPETTYYLDIPSGPIRDFAGNTTNYPGGALTFSTGPWLSLALDQSASYSTTDLRGFDPTGYDKLVAITGGERSSPPSSVTWGSSNMTLVASNSNFDGPKQTVAMWYLDGPFTGPDSLSIGGGLSWGTSLLALQGMEPGVVASANVSGLTVDLTTTSDESYVVAGCQVNGGNPSPLAPLETYCRRPNGGEQIGAGIFTNLTEGTQTFSFESGSTPSIVIAEFLITPPPAGMVLVIR